MATDKDTTDISQSPIPRGALQEMDALTQEAVAAIQAMAVAAKNMLALDPRALITVATLLDQVKSRADELMNDVNGVAERHDASWIADRELATKLWTQHRALHGTNGVVA